MSVTGTASGPSEGPPVPPIGAVPGAEVAGRPRRPSVLLVARGRTLWDGARTVAGLELRQRIRTSRWPVALGAWLTVVYGITGLLWLATRGMPDIDRGVVFSSVMVFFLLGLGMLVVPALTATSINADRDHGVLAVLQVTLLSPAQIVFGKILAAWAVTAVLLLTAMPVMLFAVAGPGVAPGPMVLALLVLLVVLGSMCAVGLCFSALTARPITSVVLTYLTVGFLTFGTLLGFVLITPLTTEQVTRTAIVWPKGSVALPGDPNFACATEQRTVEVTRTDRTWGLLAINPFVVVADAAPSAADPRRSFDPLGEISRLARTARKGPDEVIVECRTTPEGPDARTDISGVAPLWPWGFGVLIILGGVALHLATRRIATPIGALPKGIRIG